jgi:serine-type D-Ala-D-Ala carboxypeptidase (penicillin-binding protein 5/6)
MKPSRDRLRRLYPIILFVAVLAVTISTLVATAEGTTTTTTLAPTSLQQASYTVKATDLGEFSGVAPTIESPSAIVINATTGKVLYDHNAHKVRRMASTTKIMTAILVIEKMDLNETITASAKAVNTIEPVPFLKEGDSFTVEEMLYALLLRSANSAAVVLAEACSGSVEAFADEMNKKAAELGMDDSHFVNPNGLDTNGHQSTAADMAVVARYAMQNATFRTIVGTKEYTLPLPGRSSLECENTNQLLGKYDWVTGIKTGLTPKAEQCFVGSGTRDGVNVISVVLGQPSTKLCFAESKLLLEYGFTQCRGLTLLGKGDVVAEAEVPYQVDGRLQLVTAGEVRTELYKDESVTMSVQLDRDLVLPVAAGEVFGTVSLIQKGETVQTVDLVAAASYDRPTLGSKVAYLWHRMGKALGRLFS